MSRDYILKPAGDDPRLQGMQAFKDGKHFGECPNQGFREADIEWRWQWQKGWLRAQLDQKDAQNPPKHNV